MTIKNLTLAIAVIAMVIALPSCGSDDDEPIYTPTHASDAGFIALDETVYLQNIYLHSIYLLESGDAVVNGDHCSSYSVQGDTYVISDADGWGNEWRVRLLDESSGKCTVEVNDGTNTITASATISRPSTSSRNSSLYRRWKTVTYNESCTRDGVEQYNITASTRETLINLLNDLAQDPNYLYDNSLAYMRMRFNNVFRRIVSFSGLVVKGNVGCYNNNGAANMFTWTRSGNTLTIIDSAASKQTATIDGDTLTLTYSWYEQNTSTGITLNFTSTYTMVPGE